MTIFELLEDVASRHPDAPALLAASRDALSYAALHRQTSKIINALREAGIGTADKVAIVLPKGPEMAAAVVAVALGAVCAPLNPAYGADELRFYLGDLDARAIV